MARLFRITLALAGAAGAGIENVHDQFTIELPEGSLGDNERRKK